MGLALTERTVGIQQEDPPMSQNAEETLTPKLALDMRREALMAAEEPTSFTLSATDAADRVESVLPNIERHRSALEEAFGDRATHSLDELPIIMKATRQASVERTAAGSSTDLSAEHDALRAEHELLFNDAVSLAGHALLDRSLVEKARAGQSYKSRIDAVLLLVELFRAAWPELAGKTLLTRDRLDAIEAVADGMRRRLNLRESGADASDEVELEKRALASLVHHYEETRRMLMFVRWYQDDADEIAPSLWAHRGRSRGQRPANEDVTRPGTPVTPATPSPVNGGGPFTS